MEKGHVTSARAATLDDATLREMASRRPASELLEIGGVDRQKLERYGEDFLTEIRAQAAPA